MEQLSLLFQIPVPLLNPDELFDLSDNQAILEQLKESRYWERKPAGIHGKALGEYFSMWANTAPSGGLVVVGVDDDGAVSGCHHLAQEQLNHLEKSPFIYCSEARVDSKRVQVTSTSGSLSYVLLYRVHYREDKVVFDSSGRAFIRIGDEKHALNTDEIRELQIDRGQLDFEQEPCGLEYPGDFDSVALQRFFSGLREIRKPAQDHTDIELLVHRRLGKIKGGKFTPNNACALLFARDPLGIFPGCKILFLRVDGEIEQSGDQYNVIKREPFEGTIPAMIEQASSFLRSQLREFSRLGPDGKFFSALEYPDPAWTEALVNACVHRSYGLRNMNTFLKMFDDRLEIESPGGFPPTITPENIIGSHHPRNPHLMDAMFYLNLVKEHGEGTRRMRDTMAQANLPKPEFRQTSFGSGAMSVRVTLRNNVKQRKVWVDSDVTKVIGENLAKALTQEERRVLNFVVEHGNINVSQCLALLPNSLPKWHAAKRLLERMKSKGLLEHKHSEKVLRDPHACYTLPKSLIEKD